MNGYWIMLHFCRCELHQMLDKLFSSFIGLFCIFDLDLWKADFCLSVLRSGRGIDLAVFLQSSLCLSPKVLWRWDEDENECWRLWLGDNDDDAQQVWALLSSSSLLFSSSMLLSSSLSFMSWRLYFAFLLLLREAVEWTSGCCCVLCDDLDRPGTNNETN